MQDSQVAGTELRKEFALETARIIPWGEYRRTLGHCSAAVTEVYTESDEKQAVEAMMQVG